MVEDLNIILLFNNLHNKVIYSNLIILINLFFHSFTQVKKRLLSPSPINISTKESSNVKFTNIT